jgi:hypothetical protein
MKKSDIHGYDRCEVRQKWLSASLGAAAGFVNGLLGAGGGIIMVYAFKHLGGKDEDGLKDAFASTAAAILPISAVSALTYTFGGAVQLTEAAKFIIPAAAGGLLGARLMDCVSTKWLKRIFSVTVIYAGINMILRV